MASSIIRNSHSQGRCIRATQTHSLSNQSMSFLSLESGNVPLGFLAPVPMWHICCSPRFKALSHIPPAWSRSPATVWLIGCSIHTEADSIPGKLQESVPVSHQDTMQRLVQLPVRILPDCPCRGTRVSFLQSLRIGVRLLTGLLQYLYMTHVYSARTKLMPGCCGCAIRAILSS